jgi:hypothetical protein
LPCEIAVDEGIVTQIIYFQKCAVLIVEAASICGLMQRKTDAPEWNTSRDPAREGCGACRPSLKFVRHWRGRFTAHPVFLIGGYLNHGNKNEKLVTDLDDARQLERAGLPIDLPLTHREFSRAYSAHWFDLMNAHAHFAVAVHEFSDGARQGSPGKWKLVKRRLAGLSKAMQSCDAFVGKLSGNVNPPAFKNKMGTNATYSRHSLSTARCRSQNIGKALLMPPMTGHH